MAINIRTSHNCLLLWKFLQCLVTSDCTCIVTVGGGEIPVSLHIFFSFSGKSCSRRRQTRIHALLHVWIRLCQCPAATFIAVSVIIEVIVWFVAWMYVNIEVHSQLSATNFFWKTWLINENGPFAGVWCVVTEVVLFWLLLLRHWHSTR